MRLSLCLSSALLATPLALCSARAAEAPATVLSTCVERVFADPLSAAPAKPSWTAAKGDWQVVDGAWRVAERKEDQHGAVARHTRELGDFVVRYEVKLDGAKGTSLSINAPKGHLARVAVAANGVQVRKDDIDHEGPDKGQAFPVRAAPVKPGEWHTVVVEMAGDTLLASLDGEVVGFGSHPSFTGAKANVGLTVAGEYACFRNLEIWSAKPAEGWPEARKKLEPTLVAPAPAPAKGKAAKNAQS